MIKEIIDNGSGKNFERTGYTTLKPYTRQEDEAIAIENIITKNSIIIFGYVTLYMIFLYIL